MEETKKTPRAERVESPEFAERGAVVLKPEPPRRGTFTLLLPGNITWDEERDAGITRLDFRPMTRAEKVAVHLEGRVKKDPAKDWHKHPSGGDTARESAPDDEEGSR